MLKASRWLHAKHLAGDVVVQDSVLVTVPAAVDAEAGRVEVPGVGELVQVLGPGPFPEVVAPLRPVPAGDPESHIIVLRAIRIVRKVFPQEVPGSHVVFVPREVYDTPSVVRVVGLVGEKDVLPVVEFLESLKLPGFYGHVGQENGDPAPGIYLELL
jgi:hypothetical protein